MTHDLHAAHARHPGGSGRAMSGDAPRQDDPDPEPATPEADRRRSWGGLLLAAAVLLGIGVLVPFLTSPSGTPAGTATGQVSGSSASVSAGPSMPTMQVGLPVYFVSTQSHLFYRELRTLPSQGGPMATAVSAVLNVVPNDPQYESLWKGGTVNSVTTRGNRIYVDLSAASYAAFTDRVTAIDAAYQIYYTVNAVRSSLHDPLPVVLLADGNQTVPVLGNTGAAGFWSDQPSLGPVWIDQPQSADIVPVGQVRFSGYILRGNPAPTLQITQASSGAPVVQGTVKLGADDGTWQHWTYSAQLPAGDYQASIEALDTTDTVVFKVGTSGS